MAASLSAKSVAAKLCLSVGKHIHGDDYTSFFPSAFHLSSYMRPSCKDILQIYHVKDQYNILSTDFYFPMTDYICKIKVIIVNAFMINSSSDQYLFRELDF